MCRSAGICLPHIEKSNMQSLVKVNCTIVLAFMATASSTCVLITVSSGSISQSLDVHDQKAMSMIMPGLLSCNLTDMQQKTVPQIWRQLASGRIKQVGLASLGWQSDGCFSFLWMLLSINTILFLHLQQLFFLLLGAQLHKHMADLIFL